MSDSSYPTDMRYTKEHEWLRVEDSDGDKIGVVGVTEFAQNELGDVVYLELPEVGTKIETGKMFGTIESVKAVSDLFAPVSGEIQERNEELMDHPEGVNEDPHGKGWMVKIKLSNSGEVDSLMSAADYEAFIQDAGH